jgi:hypothetical protein
MEAERNSMHAQKRSFLPLLLLVNPRARARIPEMQDKRASCEHGEQAGKRLN